MSRSSSEMSLLFSNAATICFMSFVPVSSSSLLTNLRSCEVQSAHDGSKNFDEMTHDLCRTTRSISELKSSPRRKLPKISHSKDLLAALRVVSRASLMFSISSRGIRRLMSCPCIVSSWEDTLGSRAQKDSRRSVATQLCEHVEA